MAVPLRTVFFGTPEFATPTLEALAADRRFAVELVVTQPDRPAGRGRRLTPPPIKIVAERLGLPLYQPSTLRTAAAREPLSAVNADLFIVAAFGMIFGRATLDLPRLGCLNLHASLLPRFRGASPVPAAILCGDTQSGISLMRMEAGLDTGPVIATSTLDISHEATTESLTQRLAVLAARVAVESIPRYATGVLEAVPQLRADACVTRPLTRADGWLDWAQPAEALSREVRGMYPWPRAWTTRNGEQLQILETSFAETQTTVPPGTVLIVRKEPVVQCGEGALRLVLVQRAGGRPMPGSALVVGRRFRDGDQVGVDGAPEPPPPLIRWLDNDN